MNGRVPFVRRAFWLLFKKLKATVVIKNFDGDMNLVLDLPEHMQCRIFWLGYYNIQIIPYLKGCLRPGMVVIDIGANIGEVSLVSAKLVGALGRVWAFEPLNAIADKLQSNIDSNKLKQVEVVRIGLSDKKLLVFPYMPLAANGAREKRMGGWGVFLMGMMVITVFYNT